MNQRFIVMVSGLTEADERGFVTFLEGEKLNWWHQIPNCWLLTDDTGKDVLERSRQLRTHLREILNSRRGLVVHVAASEEWSGFAAQDEVTDTFRWLHANWQSNGDQN